MPPMVPRFFSAFAMVIFAIGQIYLVPKVVDVSDGLDFRLVWLAGDLWNNGINPYSDRFNQEYLQRFGLGPQSHFWVYPPSFQPLAGFLARLDFVHALQVWNILNFCFLHLASLLVARTITSAESADVLSVYLIIVGLASMMQATAVAISIGQTSFLVYLGIALLIYGYRTRQVVYVAAALTIVGLKPSVGIVLFCAVFASAHLRCAIIPAVMMHALLVMVSAAQMGLMADMIGFFGAVSSYATEGGPANAAENLIGLVQIANLFGLYLNGTILLLVACGTAFLIGWWAPDWALLTISLVCIIGLLVVPLHSYDLTFTVIVVAPTLCARFFPRSFFLLMGFVLLFRAENLARVTGITNPDGHIFPGSLIETIGLLILAIATYACWFGAERLDGDPKSKVSRS